MGWSVRGGAVAFVIVPVWAIFVEIDVQVDGMVRSRGDGREPGVSTLCAGVSPADLMRQRPRSRPRRGRSSGNGERVKVGVKAPGSDPTGELRQGFDLFDVVMAWDLDGAEALEVLGVHLAVDEREAPRSELLGGPDESHFGGIWCEGEHALAAK